MVGGISDYDKAVGWMAKADDAVPARIEALKDELRERYKATWEAPAQCEGAWGVEAEHARSVFGATFAQDVVRYVATAHALLDAGVQNVVILIKWGSSPWPAATHGAYNPTAEFGGCVLVSKRRLHLPQGLPDEWGQVGGRCTLLPGRGGDLDRVLLMEVPTPEIPAALAARGSKLNGTGFADGVCGPIGLQLSHGVAIEDALPLACALGSIALCETGAVSSYVTGLLNEEAEEEEGFLVAENEPGMMHNELQQHRAKAVGSEKLIERARQMCRSS